MRLWRTPNGEPGAGSPLRSFAPGESWRYCHRHFGSQSGALDWGRTPWYPSEKVPRGSEDSRGRRATGGRKMNLRRAVLLVCGVVIASMLFGCATCPMRKLGMGRKGTVSLCLKCGHVKGADVCCKADQPKCGKCSLAKGSPGCCNIPKDAKAPVRLCTSCGEFKGSAKCCKPATKCTKCQLSKGSPGCCKLGKSGT